MLSCWFKAMKCLIRYFSVSLEYGTVMIVTKRMTNVLLSCHALNSLIVTLRNGPFDSRRGWGGGYSFLQTLNFFLQIVWCNYFFLSSTEQNYFFYSDKEDGVFLCGEMFQS